ncbi:MAG: universal stress protein [Rubrivivax sp.]|nr:universal stress protein [Rubrivivax sp.]
MTTPAAPILAATDFSTLSRHAADRAARLARESGAALSLIHVTSAGALQELRQWLGAGHAMEQQLLAGAQAQLAALADTLAAQHAVSVRTVEAAGAVPEIVEDELRRLGAGLLVLGARGAGFLRRLVLGTTSERLLRRSHCPVLLVRQPAHASYRRILVGLDQSPVAMQVLAVARRVAPAARPVLLSAYQVPFQEELRFAGVDAATVEHYRHQARLRATQHLHTVATHAGLAPGDYEALITEGDASQRIVEYELDCDLVVLGKHGHSTVEDLLLGGVNQHVLAEGRVDMLVAPTTTAAASAA